VERIVRTAKVVVASVLLFLVFSCSSADDDGLSDPIETPAPGTEVDAVGGPLQFSHRQDYAVCVEEEEGDIETVSSTEQEVARAVLDVTPRIENTQDWKAVDLEPIKVIAGCGVSPRPWEEANVQRRTVEIPSVYPVHIIVTDEVNLTSDLRTRRTPIEDVCDGHVCAEATIGLYLTPEEASDPDLMARGLSYAIGIDPDDPLE
jgi:hypothetical protein